MAAPARYARKKLIISPREALVAGGPAEDLERTIQDHLAGGRRNIVIDLRAVPHLDSAGVRALVRGHTSAERLDGHLLIVGSNEKIRSLFHVTQLDQVFHLGETPRWSPFGPDAWATLRLVGGGALLVAALIWGGVRWPVPGATDQGVESLTRNEPAVNQVLHWLPLVDLAKLVAAAAIGILVTGVQRRLQRDKAQSRSLEHAMVLLCVAGSLMMLIIGGSIARAFGIAGAASIVRFRTPIEDPREITILFLLMGLGMLTGIGSFGVAGMATAFLCLFLLVLDWFGVQKPRTMMVEITARNREFPTAEVETVFMLNRIVFERREVSHGEKTVARYHTTLDPKLSLADVSEQLIGDGTTGIKSVVWEPPKKAE